MPFQIFRDDDVLVIRYEECNSTRTVYLDGRKFPPALDATSLGYSIGRVDNDTLVIETRRLLASTYPPIIINAPGGHSDSLHGIERYTVSSDEPEVLTLELTLEDTATLTEPYYLPQAMDRNAESGASDRQLRRHPGGIQICLVQYAQCSLARWLPCVRTLAPSATILRQIFTTSTRK